MKIKMLKDCSFQVVEQIENDDIKDVEMDAKAGEVFEGDLCDDYGERVDFQFGDGSMVFSLDRSLFEIVEE
jgi:hypothetical protein